MKLPSLKGIGNTLSSVGKNLLTGGTSSSEKEKPELSEQTKQTATQMKDTSKNMGKEMSGVAHKKTKNSAEQILGDIYKLMKEDREDYDTQKELAVTKLKDQNRQEEEWHGELIKALTYKKKPKKEEKLKEEKPKAPAPKTPAPKTPAPKAPAPRPSAGAPKPGATARPSAGAPKPGAAARPSAGAPKPGAAARPSAGAPKPGAAARPSAAPSGISPGAAAGIGATAVVATGTLYEMSKSMIKRHEGVKNAPYKDSLGLWTVGVGHLIGDGKSLPPEWNRQLSDKEVDDLFSQDYNHHMKAAEKIPGYNNLNDKGKAALIDLTFNMGPAWYKKWPSFTKALESGDIEGAAKNLETSKWYTQVGKRAPEIVAMIRAGAGSNTDTAVPAGKDDTKTASATPAKENKADQLSKPTQVASAAPMPQNKASPAPSTPASSAVAPASATNKSLKDEMAANQSSTTLVNNTTIAPPPQNKQASALMITDDDSPLHQKRIING